MRNLVHLTTSPMVPKTGKSMRFIIVELNILMNSIFSTNCMPPNSSEETLHKTSMFIHGNITWSVRSRSRSLNCLTFALISPTISNWGSQGSFSTASLKMTLLLPVALGMVSLNCQQIQNTKPGLGITTEGQGVAQACSQFRIHKLIISLWETIHPTPSS
jgi:hypothetical protein